MSNELPRLRDLHDALSSAYREAEWAFMEAEPGTESELFYKAFADDVRNHLATIEERLKVLRDLMDKRAHRE